MRIFAQDFILQGTKVSAKLEGSPICSAVER